VFFSVPVQAQQVAVPNVVGMPADQAIKTIQSLGLRAPVTVEGMTPVCPKKARQGFPCLFARLFVYRVTSLPGPPWGLRLPSCP
jgi:hypothetical protein